MDWKENRRIGKKIRKNKMNLPIYLDNLINAVYEKTNNYPTKIIMNEQTYNKLIAESKEQDLNNSWIDFSNKNYKGIDIEMQEINTIKLEE